MKIKDRLNQLADQSFSKGIFHFVILISLIPLFGALGSGIVSGLSSFGTAVDSTIPDVSIAMSIIESSEEFDSIQSSGVLDFEEVDSQQLDETNPNKVDRLINGFSLGRIIGTLFLILFSIALLISFKWCYNTQKRRMLVLLPGILMLGFLMIFYLPGFSEFFATIRTLLFSVMVTLYGGIGILSGLYFIKNGHLRSKAFFWTMICTIGFAGIPSFLLFFLSFVLLRSIYLFFHQNISIFKKITLPRLTFLFIKSLLFWLPLLLFVIPGNMLNTKLYESSIDGIYNNVFNDSIRIGDRKDQRYDKDTFQYDLNSFVDTIFLPIEGPSLDRKFAALEKSLKESAQGAKNLSEETKNTIPDQVAKIYYEESAKMLKDVWPYFKKEDCGFHILFPTSCCIMNEVKSYIKWRLIKLNLQLGLQIRALVKSQLEDLDQSLDGSKQLDAKTIEEMVAGYKNQIRSKTDAVKSSIRNSILGVFNSIQLFKFLGDFILFIVIVKSFLVVFARVAFAGDDEIYVTLLESEDMPVGNLTKCGSQYTIKASDQSNYYASRSYEPSGRAPKFSIPHKASAFLARLKSGTYALNHIVMKDREGDVYFNALGGTEFVEWELKEGEEVVFDLKNFVVMSDSVKMSVTWSFRITSLLLGRIRFITAKGPGKLVLLSKGRPITSKEPEGEASIPVSRIIAWQKNTRFHVDSELNIMDVFLSGIYLKKKENDPIIIDADEKGRAKSGISRFILSFLLPF